MTTPKPQLDPTAAPDGFYAVLKSDIAAEDNLCRYCDWRSECQKRTAITDPKERCMSYAVTCRVTGATLQRPDGCSVVFKRLPKGEA